MVIGGAIGIHLAKKVEMTEMPELVAILHSFVGPPRCWSASIAISITGRVLMR